MANCCAVEFQLKNFGFSDTSAKSFYVSEWSDNKLYFVLYRTFIFVYWTAWTIYGTIEYSWLPNGYLYYLYLSHWGEWTLVINLGILLGVAFYGLCDARTDSASSDISCFGEKCYGDELRWFHRLCWVVRTATLPVAYLITVMFWSFQVVSRASAGVNVHRHIINSVIVTLDLLVGRIPVRLLHFIYASLYGVSYGFYTLVLHWSGVRSRFYDVILNWERIPGLSAAVVIGVCVVAAPVFHALSFGMYHLKALVARRVFRIEVQGAVPQVGDAAGVDNPAMEMSEVNGSAVGIS